MRPIRSGGLSTRSAGNAVDASQAVGRKADHEGVEAAPALVAGQQLLVAEIEAEPSAFDQHLAQRRRIAIAEIDPWPAIGWMPWRASPTSASR
jgi:hypothetical protein